MNKLYTIIVAGGSGLRMQTSIPKQFLLLNDLPVLMHTINRFYKVDKQQTIVLVLPAEHFDYWEKLCQEYNFKTPHIVTNGGKTRFESVKNGLSLVSQESIVAIHDGVRPLVSAKTILLCKQKAIELGNAIPVIDMDESVRMITEKGSVSVERDRYKKVQTPQVFKSDIIINAYKQDYSLLFTDDASVVENIGIEINLVEGNKENIKITHTSDLLIASELIKQMVD